MTAPEFRPLTEEAVAEAMGFTLSDVYCSPVGGGPVAGTPVTVEDINRAYQSFTGIKLPPCSDQSAAGRRHA